MAPLLILQFPCLHRSLVTTHGLLETITDLLVLKAELSNIEENVEGPIEVRQLDGEQKSHTLVVCSSTLSSLPPVVLLFLQQSAFNDHTLWV